MGIVSANSVQIPSANTNASVMIGCYNAYYVSGETSNILFVEIKNYIFIIFCLLINLSI